MCYIDVMRTSRSISFACFWNFNAFGGREN